MFSKDKVGYFASLAVCIIGGGFLLSLLLRTLLPALLPFLIGWALALLSRGLVRRFLFSKKEEKPRTFERLLRVLFALSFLTVGMGLFGLLAWKLAVEAVGFFGTLSESGKIGEILSSLLHPFRKGTGGGAEAELGNLLSGAFSALAGKLGEFVAAFAGGIPEAFFFAVVTLISTAYFAWDLEEIHVFFLSLLPEKAKSRLYDFRENSLALAWKYLRSYGLLMLFTFGLMFVGFLILKVRYAILIAVTVAILDALPVIGVGTVLVPWSVFAFLGGNGSLGTGLLILLAVNVVSRQILEPKILGKNLGMHPLLTLALLYVGYSVFGVIGLFAVPLAALFFGARGKNENDTAEKSS